MGGILTNGKGQAKNAGELAAALETVFSVNNLNVKCFWKTSQKYPALPTTSLSPWMMGTACLHLLESHPVRHRVKHLVGFTPCCNGWFGCCLSMLPQDSGPSWCCKKTGFCLPLSHPLSHHELSPHAPCTPCHIETQQEGPHQSPNR